MEQLLVQIIQHIAESMPTLSLVDEDYGQLEAQEDTYPVTFPCVLVGNTDTDWEERNGASQRGNSSFTVRLAINCYDDTYATSGTVEKIAERQQLAHDMFKILHHYKPLPRMSQLVRVKSRDYSINGGIKVFEQIYTFRQSEEELQ